MSDIVERLRGMAISEANELEDILYEAADEIERLRKLEKANDDTIGPAMKTFEQVRAATIEECALLAIDHGNRFIAAAIRALKEQP